MNTLIILRIGLRQVQENTVIPLVIQSLLTSLAKSYWNASVSDVQLNFVVHLICSNRGRISLWRVNHFPQTSRILLFGNMARCRNKCRWIYSHTRATGNTLYKQYTLNICRGSDGSVPNSLCMARFNQKFKQASKLWKVKHISQTSSNLFFGNMARGSQQI